MAIACGAGAGDPARRAGRMCPRRSTSCAIPSPRAGPSARSISWMRSRGSAGSSRWRLACPPRASWRSSARCDGRVACRSASLSTTGRVQEQNAQSVAACAHRYEIPANGLMDGGPSRQAAFAALVSCGARKWSISRRIVVDCVGSAIGVCVNMRPPDGNVDRIVPSLTCEEILASLALICCDWSATRSLHTRGWGRSIAHLLAPA